jgi:hypothetical protein
VSECNGQRICRLKVWSVLNANRMETNNRLAELIKSLCLDAYVCGHERGWNEGWAAADEARE